MDLKIQHINGVRVISQIANIRFILMVVTLKEMWCVVGCCKEAVLNPFYFLFSQRPCHLFWMLPPLLRTLTTPRFMRPASRIGELNEVSEWAPGNRLSLNIIFFF